MTLALTASQWREKHQRKANRLRGKAAALSLSILEWKAKRFAPGARVVARFVGWERWVIYEQDSANASDDERADPSQEKYAEVWYFQPETGKSSYDPPPEWPEKEGEPAALTLPSFDESKAQEQLKALPCVLLLI